MADSHNHNHQGHDHSHAHVTANANGKLTVHVIVKDPNEIDGVIEEVREAVEPLGVSHSPLRPSSACRFRRKRPEIHIAIHANK